MRITELKPSAHKQGRWLVRLDSGELLRVGESEVVRFALYAGMELSEGEPERLREAARTAGFREYALNLLAGRPMSRAELERRLGEKQCPPEQAAAIAGRLEELGYLNDEQYAQTVVKHYAAKGYGPYKIRDELYRRGVPREYWEQALAQRADPAAEMDAFVAKKLAGVEQPDRKQLKRVSDALARRGYAWQDISAALNRYGGAEE